MIVVALSSPGYDASGSAVAPSSAFRERCAEAVGKHGLSLVLFVSKGEEYTNNQNNNDNKRDGGLCRQELLYTSDILSLKHEKSTTEIGNPQSVFWL